MIELNLTPDTMSADELIRTAKYLLDLSGKHYSIGADQEISNSETSEQMYARLSEENKDSLRRVFNTVVAEVEADRKKRGANRKPIDPDNRDVNEESGGKKGVPQGDYSTDTNTEKTFTTPPCENVSNHRATLTIGSAVIPLPPGTTGATVVAGGGGLDSEGLPYDLRIHSRTRSKIKQTGAWKKKRGLDEQYAREVENELRVRYGAMKTVDPAVPGTDRTVIAVHSGGTPGGRGNATTAYNPDALPVPPAPLELPQERFATPAPSNYNPDALPVPTAPTSVPAAPTMPGAFPEFCQKYTSAIHHKKITMQQGVELLLTYGVDNLPLVGTKPEIIPALTIALARLIADEGGVI